MALNHIIATDDFIHEMICIDENNQRSLISFTKEIQLDEDIVKILVHNEEEIFILDDEYVSEICLNDCHESIMLAPKKIDVCFKVENATQEYQITCETSNESIPICLNAENHYQQCLSYVSCGIHKIYLPKGLVLCDEQGEHADEVEISFRLGQSHCVLLKEQPLFQLRIRGNACIKDTIMVTMKHPHFHQCFYLNAQNQYQVQLSGLSQGKYCFECDGDLAFYHQHHCFPQSVELNLTDEPLELWLSSPNSGDTTFVFHNTSDQMISFSLFSLSYHQCLNIQPFQRLSLEQMTMGAYSIQSEDEISLCLNGQTLKKSTFCIEHAGCYHFHLGLSSRQALANLHISFYEESLQANFMTPSECNQRFLSLVCEEIKYDILLNAHNGFQAYLTSLPTGYYQIIGCEEDGVYLNEEKVHSSFYLGDGQHQLQLIAPLKRYYDLNISASILDQNEYIQCEESIQGILQSKKLSLPFCLNAENDHCVCFQQLCKDEYQIIIPCIQDHQVSYQWNHRFKSQPLFMLCEDSECLIVLEPFTYGGMLSMRLLQETSDGQLYPCQSGSYHIQMKGHGYSHTHCFNETNGYELALWNLKAMNYCLSLCEGYPVQMYSHDHEDLSCFELTQDDLEIDVILKYRNEDVIITLNEPYECVCLLCGQNEETVLRFYEGNQYQCILSNLAHGIYQIKAMYDQKLIMSIDHRHQSNHEFIYEGKGLDILLQLQQTCCIECYIEQEAAKNTAYELIYHINHVQQSVSLNQANQYHHTLYCQKYDELSWMVEDAKIYVEGEKLDSTSICVMEEHLEVMIVPDDCRCVLYMEKSQCSCMEEQVVFELEYQGQKEKIELSNQKGIRLRKGTYHFHSDDHEFVLDGVQGNVFELQKDDHSLMIYKKQATTSLSIYGNHHCKGRIYNEINEYHFVLNEANHYMCMIDKLPLGTYQMDQSPLIKFLLDDQEVSELTLTLPAHRIDCKIKEWNLQMIKYEKRNGIYTRQDLHDLSLQIHDHCYEFNAENEWKINLNLHVNDLTIETKGRGRIIYLIDGKEYESCKNVGPHIQTIGIVEDLEAYGSLKIHAMIETEGGYRRIQEADDLSLILDGFQQPVELNHENDHTFFMDHLLFQDYQLHCDQEVEYRLNGEVLKGLYHHYGDNVLLVIVKQIKHCFTFVLDESLDEASFYLWNGANQQEIRLNQQHRQYEMNGINEDIYVVDDQNDYLYVINDDKEVRYPVLKGNQSYHIKVLKKASHHLYTLTIEKKMMLNGELIKPQAHQAFEVDILSNGHDQRIRLDESNQFKMVLSQLARGDYEVREVLQGDHETSYIVNEGIRSYKAMVHLHEDVHVCIINEFSMQQGSLRIEKYIEQNDGSLIVPASGDEYRFVLASSQYEENIVLNAENQFRQWITHLREGIYTLKEELGIGMVASYQINHGAYQKEANFMIHNGQCIEVKVKNQLVKNLAQISVFQYVQQADGTYQKPMRGDDSFLLKGPLDTKEYRLNAENDYQVNIEDLVTGEYEIISSLENVAYFVNEPQLQKQAIFTLEPEDEVVIAIVKPFEKVNMETDGKTRQQVLQLKI